MNPSSLPPGSSKVRTGQVPPQKSEQKPKGNRFTNRLSLLKDKIGVKKNTSSTSSQPTQKKVEEIKKSTEATTSSTSSQPIQTGVIKLETPRKMEVVKNVQVTPRKVITTPDGKRTLVEPTYEERTEVVGIEKISEWTEEEYAEVKKTLLGSLDHFKKFLNTFLCRVLGITEAQLTEGIKKGSIKGFDKMKIDKEKNCFVLNNDVMENGIIPLLRSTSNIVCVNLCLFQDEIYEDALIKFFKALPRTNVVDVTISKELSLNSDEKLAIKSAQETLLQLGRKLTVHFLTKEESGVEFRLPYIFDITKREFFEVVRKSNLDVRAIRYDLAKDKLILDRVAMEKVIIPILEADPNITSIHLDLFQVIEEGALVKFFEALPRTQVKKITILKARPLNEQESQAWERVKKVLPTLSLVRTMSTLDFVKKTLPQLFNISEEVLLETAKKKNVDLEFIDWDTKKDCLIVDCRGMDKVIVPILKAIPEIEELDFEVFDDEIKDGALVVLFEALPKTKVNKIKILKERVLTENEAIYLRQAEENLKKLSRPLTIIRISKEARLLRNKVKNILLTVFRVTEEVLSKAIQKLGIDLSTMQIHSTKNCLIIDDQAMDRVILPILKSIPTITVLSLDYADDEIHGNALINLFNALPSTTVQTIRIPKERVLSDREAQAMEALKRSNNKLQVIRTISKEESQRNTIKNILRNVFEVTEETLSETIWKLGVDLSTIHIHSTKKCLIVDDQAMEKVIIPILKSIPTITVFNLDDAGDEINGNALVKLFNVLPSTTVQTIRIPKKRVLSDHETQVLEKLKRENDKLTVIRSMSQEERHSEFMENNLNKVFKMPKELFSEAVKKLGIHFEAIRHHSKKDCYILSDYVMENVILPILKAYPTIKEIDLTMFRDEIQCNLTHFFTFLANTGVENLIISEQRLLTTGETQSLEATKKALNSLGLALRITYLKDIIKKNIELVLSLVFNGSTSKELSNCIKQANIDLSIIKYDHSNCSIDPDGMEKVIIEILKKYSPAITEVDLSFPRIKDGALSIFFKLLPETKVTKVVLDEETILSEEENRSLESAKRILSQRGQSLELSFS